MSDIHIDHARLAGGAGLAGLSAITMNDVVMALTALYFILQIGLLLPRYRWFRKLFNLPEPPASKE